MSLPTEPNHLKIRNSKNEFIIFFGSVWLIFFFYKIDLVIKALKASSVSRAFFFSIFCCLVTIWLLSEFIQRLFFLNEFSIAEGNLKISIGLPFLKTTKTYEIRNISAIKIGSVDSNWGSYFGGLFIPAKVNAITFVYNGNEIIIGKKITDTDLEKLQNWMKNLPR